MSAPDPYRQHPQPPYGPPTPPVPGQPPIPSAAYPYGQVPPQAFPGNYPAAAPAYPQYPQQPAYPQAYQAPYPPQPSYAQPGYPVAQPAYPPAAPVAPAVPQTNDYQQQAFQAPVTPVVGRPVAIPAAPATTAAASPVPAPSSPVAKATPVAAAKPIAANRPVAVSAASTAAPSAPATSKPVPIPVGSGAARPVLVKKSEQDLMKVQDEPTADDAEEKPPEAVRKAPPWLISLVVHMVVLIIMGLIYLPSLYEPKVELDVVWAEKIGEQLLDSSVLESSPEPIETLDTNWAKDMQIVEDPLAAPPEMAIDPLIAGTTATSDIAAPTIGMALSGREKGAKAALLAAYGGTKSTEEAVRLGLLWLKKNQKADGSWSLMGSYGEGATQENSTSATAMALLAFQGAGNTHREGEFKDVVAKGWKWLLSKQNADGDFVQESVYHARLYTQAQCTIAVCELYGMTKDQQYRKPAQLAIDFAIKSQDPSGGGWRYTPRQDSDLSVTGWFVIALQSAMMAGLEVPSPQMDSISKFLDSVQHRDGAEYSYKPGQGPTVTMTAEGLLSRQYLGWKHADPRLRAGVDYLLQNKLDYSDQNVYYWYYASQVLHHMGHEDWDKWNAVMREEVPNAQTKTGKEAGSWSPTNDRWGAHGGRLYVTCLSVYMLEVYYRHLPIYKHQIQ